MTPEQSRSIALAVLKKGKTIAVRYFPRFETPNGQIDWEIIDAWAAELSTRNYPPQLWEKAVSHWVNHIAQHGDIATTGDILKAAKHVWGQWADNPETAGYVENYQLAQLDQKYQATVPGYIPGSVFPTTDDTRPELPPADMFDQLKQRLAKARVARKIEG